MLFSALENNNFCIFTGGPGSGKTTVLNLLSNIGYMTNTYEEFGYQIVTVPYLKPEERVQWIIEELNVNTETASIK